MFMIRRLNKIANFPKFTYGLNVSIKIPYDFFAEIDNLILKFTLKFKGPTTARTILKKSNKMENSHFPISKLQSFSE